MTDGTHEVNQAYREGVGLYYDLVKANVERILIGLTAELATLRSPPSRSLPDGCGRRQCWITSGSPSRAGETHA